LDRLVRHYLETPALPAVEQWTIDVGGKLGFLWGVGVVHGYLKEYYVSGPPSPWTAFKTLSRAVASTVVNGPMIRRMTHAPEIEVETDSGEKWGPRPFLSVAAATIEDIGLGFRPFHMARKVRGTFHLLGIHTSPLGFVLDLPRIHRAEAMRAGKVDESLVRRAVIRSREPQIRYMLDGDLHEHKGSELTLRIGPAVRIATMN
jgi:hypothetical protein